jgi:hypothetical protein
MLRFQSQVMIDNLPDEQLDSKWECVLPSINLDTAFGGIPYTPIVEEIVFRGTSFSNEEFRVGTRFYNLPSDRQSFGEASLTLFCEQGMLPVYYLQSWRNLIFDPVHQYYYCNARYDMDTNKSTGLEILSSNGDKSVYMSGGSQINATSHWKKDIEIYFYGVGSVTPIAHATLYNAYPVSQGDYSLEYSMEPKRFRITCSFRYDNLVWDSSYRNTAIISSLLAGNPIGTLMDQGINAVSNMIANAWEGNNSAIDKIVAQQDSI